MRKNDGQPNKIRRGKNRSETTADVRPSEILQGDGEDEGLKSLSVEVEREKAALLRKKAEIEEIDSLRARQLDFSDMEQKPVEPIKIGGERRCGERPRVFRAATFALLSLVLVAAFFLPAITANGHSVSAFDLLGLTPAGKDNLAAFLVPLTPAQASLIARMKLPLWGAAVCMIVSAVNALFMAKYHSAIKTLAAALYSAAFVFLVCVIILINLALSIGAVCYGLMILAAGDLGLLLMLLCFYNRLKIKL